MLTLYQRFFTEDSGPLPSKHGSLGVLASLDQLEKCHRRHDDVMERLLASARRLAAGRPDSGDVDTVREAVSYFKRSITRHFLDEEGSLFPRLSTRRPELAEQLAALSAEHPQQVELQDRIGEIAASLDGESRQGFGKALLEAAEQLANAHRTHVAREDHVFVLARDALTVEDDAGILAEMETRRDRRARTETADGGEPTVPIPRRTRAETVAETPKAIKIAPAKKNQPAKKRPAVAAKKTSAAKKKPAAKKKKR